MCTHTLYRDTLNVGGAAVTLGKTVAAAVAEAAWYGSTVVIISSSSSRV